MTGPDLPIKNKQDVQDPTLLKPFDGFVPLQTHHCVTGSLRHIYAFNAKDVSEEMLLGLGEGVGFMYWHARGHEPFMGGRAVSKPGMEELVGQRMGIKIVSHLTSSPRKANQALLEQLELGLPIMLQVDMGCLPYFDFGGQEYHFGGHVVVACGYDQASQQILIADRDGVHPVPFADLERARSSAFKPFPPRNCWWTFDFHQFRYPDPADLRQAIAAQAARMLEPPIHNFGIQGIRLAAKRIPGWPSSMDIEQVRQALFNAYIFISPVGGTGGGLFRYMFSRFLNETAVITSNERLHAHAEAFNQMGDAWENLAAWAKEVSAIPDPAARLGECSAALLAIADQEQAAWELLREEGKLK
jgi:Domain of unknown function (DUF4872)/Butirosin biosynthesis protein H, N-terminal